MADDPLPDGVLGEVYMAPYSEWYEIYASDMQTYGDNIYEEFEYLTGLSQIYIWVFNNSSPGNNSEYGCWEYIPKQTAENNLIDIYRLYTTEHFKYYYITTSGADNPENPLGVYVLPHEYLGTESSAESTVTDIVPVIRTDEMTYLDQYDFSFTGQPESIVLRPAIYKFECWGAQGCHSHTQSESYPGGKGGYSCGYIEIKEDTTCYIYVGQQGGRYGNYNYTFNTGNNKTYGTTSTGGTGGGATDIRIGSQSLYARVIVAGGGGGSSYYSTTSFGYGGYAGGYTGGNGTCRSNVPNGEGKGGTQIAGGLSGTRTVPNNADSGFGKAGYSTWTNDSSGGNGWYGGGSAGRSNSDGFEGGGGGGSGFVYTAVNYAVWNSGNPTDASQYLLTPEYYMFGDVLSDGNTVFLSPLGEPEVGHSGSGFARITLVNYHKPFNTNVLYDKEQPSTWNEDHIKQDEIIESVLSVAIDYDKQSNILSGTTAPSIDVGKNGDIFILYEEDE